jgi:hypothetical protein
LGFMLAAVDTGVLVLVKRLGGVLTWERRTIDCATADDSRIRAASGRRSSRYTRVVTRGWLVQTTSEGAEGMADDGGEAAKKVQVGVLSR